MKLKNALEKTKQNFYVSLKMVQTKYDKVLNKK